MLSILQMDLEEIILLGETEFILVGHKNQTFEHFKIKRGNYYYWLTDNEEWSTDHCNPYILSERHTFDTYIIIKATYDNSTATNN